MQDIVVVGGGPAGFFAAICAKEKDPTASILLIEKSSSLLAKVMASGGGRCNLTHALFDPKRLIAYYPRGSKELLGPFHTFGPQETVNWFETHKVPLKTESDGRIFPTTERSKTIVHALLQEASRLHVSIVTGCSVLHVQKETNSFHLHTDSLNTIACKKLIIATGSDPTGYEVAQNFGHTIVPPIPALFALQVDSSFLHSLTGTTINKVKMQILGTHFEHEAGLLITHFGLSGPCTITLSSKAARYLYEHQYSCEIAIQWVPELSEEALLERLVSCKQQNPNKHMYSENPYHLNKPFWKALTSSFGEICYKNASKELLRKLAQKIHRDVYHVSGRATHKEEFVTCGGVSLQEINFKTMESKIIPGLFFAGEVLDIDGLTGGFNLQNAWTTGYIAGQSMV